MKTDVFKEKVFIAWGGNQPLAGDVSKALQTYGYAGIVGGGAPTDMFIGSQIFSQIKKCTQAIVLVQLKQNEPLNYNDNLMFEWGYLTAKLMPDKLHVFLINISTKDLPSDLAGSWAKEVGGADQSQKEIADEIASYFAQTAKGQNVTDKLEIMHDWERTKRYVKLHEQDPCCSEAELANYILHGIESCYYCGDVAEMSPVMETINPISMTLELTLQIWKANATLFSATNDLREALSFDQFFDLKIVFESKFDLSYQDEDLDRWLHFFCVDRLSLCYMCIAENTELEEQEKVAYLNDAIRSTLFGINLIAEILQKAPQDAPYALQFQGYLYRNLQLLYEKLGNEDKVKEYVNKSVDARRQFYMNYKRRFPQDNLFINKFAQEYYLSLIEKIKTSKEETEIITIKRTVRSYLNKLEDESARQHALLDMLRKEFSSMER